MAREEEFLERYERYKEEMETRRVRTLGQHAMWRPGNG